MESCCNNDMARRLRDEIRDTVDDDKDNMAKCGCDKLAGYSGQNYNPVIIFSIYCSSSFL